MKNLSKLHMELENKRRSARRLDLNPRGTILGGAVRVLTTGAAAGVMAWVLVGGGMTACAAAAAPSMAGGAAGTAPLAEVMEILKANLAGANDTELNRAAVVGLIQQLGPRARWIEPGATGVVASAAATVAAAGPAVTTGVFERTLGYVRLARLGADSGGAFRAAFEGLAASNKLQALVLDLRFTSGGDNGAAVAVADRFFSVERELADWGDGVRKSTAKSNAVALPLAVLVNRRTSGPAEVLAGMLRQADVALLVGTNTAGEASVTRDFPLKSGGSLRVAVAPVKVLNERELPFTGLVPDIAVAVDPDEEWAHLADAYRAPRLAGGGGAAEAAASTNGTIRPRRRMNEAELVRMTREGQDPRELTSPAVAPAARSPEPGTSQVTDPALARALDILKGLVLLQRFRGN